MTPKEILAENYDAIEGICRRLLAGECMVWENGPVAYALEKDMKRLAKEKGHQLEFEKAEATKQRGQRLVVIVTPSETLYQFV